MFTGVASGDRPIRRVPQGDWLTKGSVRGPRGAATEDALALINDWFRTGRPR